MACKSVVRLTVRSLKDTELVKSFIWQRILGHVLHFILIEVLQATVRVTGILNAHANNKLVLFTI